MIATRHTGHAARGEHRGDQLRGGALAVGAGDGDDGRGVEGEDRLARKHARRRGSRGRGRAASYVRSAVRPEAVA